MFQRIEQVLTFSMLSLHIGQRKCTHCGKWYLKSEMVKIPETGWYHLEHPIKFYIRFFPG